MKKGLSLILIAALLMGVLMLAGCEKKQEPAAGMPNPRTQYASLEEINEISGMHLAGPGVMGKHSEEYYIIENGELKIAEYDFAVAGHDYILRGAATAEDISGIYAGEGTIFSSVEDGNEAVVSTEKYKAARWFTEAGQYVFVVEDQGELDDETFESIVEEMKLVTDPSALTGGIGKDSANPMTEYESLEEINEIAGTNLIGPGVMGKSNQQYFIIDCGDYSLADYRFTLNGIDYMFRAAPVSEDISGIYTEGGTVFEGQDGEVIVSTDDGRAARWYDGEIQYVLATRGGEVEEEVFEAMVSELKALVAEQ